MPVELNVRSSLSKIIAELQQIETAAKHVGDALGDSGEKVGDDLNSKAKQTETFLSRLQSYGGRVADQLTRDFKALASVNALAGSLKFSETFRGSIRETVTLSDSIRKLSGTLGIAGRDMAAFQSKATRAMAQIGLSSEAASNALSGLSETPVRGQDNILAYARTAGQLASVSREPGREGDISRGLSRVVTARGGNPNDLGQLQNVANDVLRIRSASGRSATEVLGAMEQLFSGANAQFQKRLQGGGATTLATAALLGGADATAFMEKYLKSNRFQRFGPEAQGLGSILNGQGGLNLGAMQGILGAAKGRGLGDVQAGLTTFGMTDEEAKGFIRLTDALRENEAVVEGARKRQVDLNGAYRESLGLGEAFKANLNRTKGFFATPLAYGTQGLSKALGAASQSDLGAIGVTAGSGILAAVLAGGGLRGIGKAVAGGAAAEAATGQKVTPVFVTNWPAGGLGGGAAGGGIAGALSSVGFGTLAALGATAAAGVGAAVAIPAAYQKIAGREKGDPEFLDAFMKSMRALLAGETLRAAPANPRVRVELNKRELRETAPTSRGGSYGPNH